MSVREDNELVKIFQKYFNFIAENLDINLFVTIVDKDLAVIQPLYVHKFKKDTESPLSKIFHKFSQGSMLGYLVFIIFLCDIFLLVLDIDSASYADENTPHKTDKYGTIYLQDFSTNLILAQYIALKIMIYIYIYISGNG